MRRGFAAAGLALLCSCSTTDGTKLGVRRVDRTTYEVRAHVIGSLSGTDAVQSKTNEIAASFCAEKNGTPVVVGRQGYGGVASQDVLTFRCVDATPAAPRVAKPAKGA